MKKAKDLNRFLKTCISYRDCADVQEFHKRTKKKFETELSSGCGINRVHESSPSLHSIEKTGLVFSIADLIENNNFSNLRLKRHFLRWVVMMRFFILNGERRQTELRFVDLSDTILTFFSLGIVIGSGKQTSWFAGALIDSFQRQQDTWALEDDYMSAMAYQLAFCIKNNKFALADNLPPVEIVATLFSSPSKEDFCQNLLKCYDYRYNNAYRGVVNQKSTEFYDGLALSYIPLELLACEILYNKCSGTLNLAT
jgi:hypothetical protein